MEDTENRSILESLLFIVGEPISIDALAKILDIKSDEANSLVQELISDYTLRDSGLLIVEVAEGVQMVTNPVSAPWVKKLIATAILTKLSNQSLETLSIIAYKQPIIKSEVEAIRGVNSDGVVKTLLERRMVKILGRKEVPGRPLMYGTTKEFLQYFGLKDLSELPTLKDFEEEESEDLLTDDVDNLEIMKERGKALAEAGEAAIEPEVIEPVENDEGLEADDAVSLPDEDEEEVAVESQVEPEPSRPE